VRKNLHATVQVEQSCGRTDKYREFALAVDNARDDPDELFDWAQSEGHPGETPGQSSGCLVSAFLERIEFDSDWEAQHLCYFRRV
jgi:hypothetical protein